MKKTNLENQLQSELDAVNNDRDRLIKEIEQLDKIKSQVVNDKNALKQENIFLSNEVNLLRIVVCQRDKELLKLA